MKQNNIDDEAVRRFHDFVLSIDEESIILGCTELPIIYRECVKSGLTFGAKKIYDPLQSAINILVKI